MMETRLWRRSVHGAALVFVLGLASTCAATWATASSNRAVAEADLRDVTHRVAAHLRERLRRYEYGLRGARGAVLAAGAETLTREQFRTYERSRNLPLEFPGERGIGFVRRVPEAQEAEFLRGAQRDHGPSFAVRTFAPHTGDRFVIQFVEPASRNQQALGLDIASEASRRDAAERALRTGEVTLTAPITLVQASTHRQRSFLLLLPIYEGGSTPESEAERVARSPGWVYSPLVADEVLADLDLQRGRIALRLRDPSASEAVFFESDNADAPVDPGLAQRTSLSLYGRVWDVEVWATPTFMAALHPVPPGAVAALGLCLTLLLSALAFLVSQHRERGLLLAAEQARRAQIVRNSHEAIVVTTLDGLVTDWNEGATRLFGYTAPEAVGQSLASLIVPEALEGEHAAQLERLRTGGTLAELETLRRAKDGSSREVSVSLSPIHDAHGGCAGAGFILRDVAHVHRTARELERRVDEHTRLEAAARHDLETLLDAVPSVVGYWDAELVIRVANRPYAESYGVEASQVVGRHMRDVLGSEAFERDRAHVDAALRGEPTHFRRCLRRPDGSEHHALVHLVPDLRGGRVQGFYDIEHDETDLTLARTERAAAVRENEALLRTLHHHNLVSVADRSGRILDANEKFCATSGYAREELLRRTHRVINSGVHPPEFWKQMWATISSGQTWRGEVCNRAKDGSLYWVDSTITPLLDETGRVERYISVRTDITAAKRTEEQLRASEAFLDRASRAAGVGAWQLELETEEVWWSQELHRLHEVEPGYRPNLSSGLAFYSEDSRPVVSAAVAEAQRSGRGWDLELTLVTARGRTRWVRTVGEVQIVDGRVVRLVGALQDITDRKHAEIALAATYERFALASEAAGMGVWEYDLTANCLTWDDQMYALYAAPRSGAKEPYSIWAQRLHPDDRVRCERELEDAIAAGRPFDTTFRIVWPDGDVRHIKATARVHRDANGVPRRVVGTNVDVTASERAARELRDTWSLLRTVLDSASEVAIIATDPALNIEVFNAGAERLLGYRSAEIVGKSTPLLLHDTEEIATRAAELTRSLDHTVIGGQVLTDPATLHQPREWTYVRKDGSRVAVSIVVTPMTTEGGRTSGYLVIAHDATRQKEVEASLREAARAAESASLAKSQFLANMSHEIRTPMNAVIGLCHILGQTPLAPDQAACLTKLNTAGNSLRALIDDILDLSKIEAGELRIENAPFDLRKLVREIEDVMRIPADEKGIQLGTVWCDSPGRVLRGDAHRLRQVLVNLLSNAIKFTEHGGVQLRIERAQTPASGPRHERLRLTVRDSGIGIPAEQQARLFQPFAQADTSTTRRFGGTGLGLSIVKRLVSLMGGEVGLSSAPGLGSAFWVELELAVGQDAELAPARMEPLVKRLAGVRVLVVDDSDVNREVASRTLALQGAVVSSACDGRQAVELLARSPAAFDIVLMDVQMPVVDGPEATRRIRNELGLTLPILALSAGTLESETELALAAGMDGFVSKPFYPAELGERIERLVRREGAGPRRAGAPSAGLGWPSLPGVDLVAASSRLGGDRRRYETLLRGLCESLREVVQAGGTIDFADLAKGAARAHELRGSAGLLGVLAIERAGKELEQACRVGASARAAAAASALVEEARTFLEAAAGAPGWELGPDAAASPTVVAAPFPDDRGSMSPPAVA
jgi:PAS domain S-box-containing protein